MKKEIKFSAKLDSDEFNRSVDQMQRKLKEIYAPSDAIRMQNQNAGRLEQAGIGGMSKPSQETYQRATQQSRREIDQFLQKEIQNQDKLAKKISEKNDKLKELNRLAKEGNKTDEEKLAIQERIAAVEKQRIAQQTRLNAGQKGIESALDARDKTNPTGMAGMAQAYQGAGGGVKGLMAAGKFGFNANPIGISAAIAGTIGTGLQVGGSLYNNFKNAPIATSSNYGAATQGLYGKEAGAAYSGRSAIEMAFMPEKMRAFQMAQAGIKGERVKNVTDLAGNALQGGAEYGLKGAAWGAGIGGVIGGVGGAAAGGVGAIPGAIGGAALGSKIGAGAGALYGVGKQFFGENGDKATALALSPFSSTQNAKYESMMAKNFSEKYQTALEGEKNKDPYKMLASEQYQGSYMNNLNFQRSAGLNFDSFHGKGGYREQAINAGFTDDMAMQSSQALLGAGGSTRMAQDSSFAMKAGRGFGMTNAASTLGTLSNSLGDSETSKQTYIKMLAEGTKIGLDSSQYAEENRRFMDAQAQAVNQSNTGSASDMERIMNMMGAGLTDKSNKGVAAAAGAFQQYNNNSSANEGPRGVMRATSFMKDDVIGKMGAMDRQALANIDQSQISEDHPVVQSLARQYNTTPKDLVNRYLKAGDDSRNTLGGADKARQKSKDLQKQLAGITGNSVADQKQREDIQARLTEANQDSAKFQIVQNPEMGKDRRGLESYTAMDNALDPAGQLKTDGIQAKLDNKKTDKVEDESVAGAAESSRVVLQNFIKFKDELIPAAEAVKAFNEKIQRMVELSKQMNDEDRAKFNQTMGLFLGIGGNQPAATAPGGGTK